MLQKQKFTSRWWNLRRKGFKENNLKELKSLFVTKKASHFYLGNEDVFELQDHIKASESSKPRYFHPSPW